MPNVKQSKLDLLLRAAEASCAENGARLTQRRRQVLTVLMQSSVRYLHTGARPVQPFNDIRNASHVGLSDS